MARVATGQLHFASGRVRRRKLIIRINGRRRAFTGKQVMKHETRIFISAAEPSADMHAASLIRAVTQLDGNTTFTGVAGPRMRDAGCDGVFDMTAHAAMLTSALGSVRQAADMMRKATNCLQSRRWDAIVVVDSPTLHLPLALRAHALGIPTMYYIAPPLWAWGRNRIYKLRHCIDEVAAILPFEEAFFRAEGVRATFVGHPLVDSIKAEPPDATVAAMLRGQGDPVVGLLPGSRRHVVEQILPGQLEVAQAIRRVFPQVAFAVSVAGAGVEPLIQRLVRASGVSAKLLVGQHRAIIDASDLVLVASGTTTLEVAFFQTPMIVMYNASKWMYQLIGRWMVRIPHYSLPNILAGERIVPEFMPYYTSTRPIAAEAISLLQSIDERRAMVMRLSEITRPLHDRSASQRAARMLLDLCRKHAH